MHYNIASLPKKVDLINCYLVTFYGKYIYIGMASRFDFYSFTGYELLISAIAFPLEKMLIVDICNCIFFTSIMSP